MKKKMKEQSKYDRLLAAINTFKSSKQNEKDYLEFMVEFTMSLRQGDGLSWDQVTDAIFEALSEKEIQEEFDYDIKP